MLLLQFGTDHKLAVASIPSNQKNIGLAADLAVFHVALAGTGGFVDGRVVPLTAACALETGKHSSILGPGGAASL